MASSRFKARRYDHFAIDREPRWIVGLCRYSSVVVSRELPPGTELKGPFVEELERLKASGWVLESEDPLHFANTFAYRGAERIHVKLSATHPTDLAPCETCSKRLTGCLRFDSVKVAPAGAEPSAGE